MKTALVAVLLLCATTLAQIPHRNTIFVDFTVDGKKVPCEDLRVGLRLNGYDVAQPQVSNQSFIVPSVFNKEQWPSETKVDINVRCGEYDLSFSEYPSWLRPGQWEVGVSRPPFWFEDFGWTGAIEKGTWLSYLKSTCNGCDPGVFTTASHDDALPNLVAALTEEQRSASGERARDIAYTLAVFNMEYDRNRGQLLKTLDDCLAKPKNSPEDDVCNDRLLDYVTNLYWRGDSDLLNLLLRLADSRKDVISDIGRFYANSLDRHTADAVDVLRSLPSEKQRTICKLAGEDEFSLDSPKFERVAEQLRAIGDNTAQSCLEQAEKAANDVPWRRNTN